jgi:hypothetical protein
MQTIEILLKSFYIGTFLALEGVDFDHGTNKKQNGTSCWNLSKAYVLILAI